MKNKISAGLLALFLGGLGVHKFYLDDEGGGLIILLINVFLCWTIIVPIIIGIITFIQAIIYLCMTDEEFDKKYNKI